MKHDFVTALEAAIARFENQMRSHPDKLRGPDWWQLSREEELVFGINWERWPRMATVHEWYEGFMQIASGGEWPEEQMEAARTAHPDLAQQPEGEAAFLAFARRFGGLTAREATATYQKVYFWTLRGGHVRFSDEH